MVEIKNLTKRFGSFIAVDNVSFTVEKGEVLGFLGPNGAGKSTTMKMVTGFLAPDSGSVRVAGADLDQDPIAVKSSIGYLPEGAPLYGDMSPRGFLDFVAAIRGINGAERRKRIDAVVEQVSLAEVFDKPIETLSKGFKRRVGIAQAILHDPEVLILDEPTDGLDPNQKHEVRNLIQKMSPGKVIILSTHILEEVEAVCSRAIIIAAGQMVFDGTPAELVARSERHNAVSVTVRSDRAEACEGAVKDLTGVASVASEALGDGRTRVLISPLNGATLLEPVTGALRSHEIEIDEVFVERGRLDDVFRDITIGAGSRS